MATSAQLEIIGPGGSVEFYPLDRPQGVINIGRHPDNDIIIDSPNVAPFHAVVDYRQWPCQVILLSEEGQTTLEGQQLAANSPTTMDNWSTIRVDGYDIILLHAGAPPPQQPAPTAVPAAPPMGPPMAPPMGPPAFEQPMTVISAGPMPPPAVPAAVPAVPAMPPSGMPAEPISVGFGQENEYIVTSLTEDAWEIDVEQTATTELTITNGGERVASFFVHVEGIGTDWVYIERSQVRLNEGGRTTIPIMIIPPRAPTSLAGQHHIAIVVTSDTYPGASRRMAILTIHPYYETSVGEMSPKVLPLSWGKPEGAVTVPVKNNGNSPIQFTLVATQEQGAGISQRRKCDFEFEVPGEEASMATSAAISLPPGGSHAVPIVVTPPRVFIALGKDTHSFKITTTVQLGDQAPRSQSGKATMRPLIGPFFIALFALLVLALVVFTYVPIRSPQLTASLSRTESYMQEVVLFYNAYRFPEVGSKHPLNLINIINGASLEGTVEYKSDSEPNWELLHTPEEPQGAVSHIPIANGKYRVRVDTWISNMLPFLTGETERRITVPPVPPRIVSFNAVPETINVGESVTVTWAISDAETAALDLGQGVESIEETSRGSRQLSLEQSTTFALWAQNIFAQVNRVKTVNVRPTPTPPPPPRINAFSANPVNLVRGEDTQTALSWNVTTFAEDTSIDLSILGGSPIGVGLASTDKMTVPVADTTVFMLSASQGENVDTRQAMVTMVDPTPTPTPLPPEAPEIDLFSGTPNEVVAGDREVVTLQWRVVGDTTNVEITAPNLKLSGLKPNADIDVTVNETTLFVLTAYNEDQSSSQPLEIKAIDPTPTPTPIPPPPVIRFFTVVGPVDSITQRDSYTTAQGTTNVYDVVAATQVQLNWLVEGADDILLTGPALSEGVTYQGPRDIGQIVSNGTYALTARNDGGTVVATVIINVQLLAPPVPFDVQGIQGTSEISVTWRYNYAAFQKPYFVGFRIYSADVSPLSSDTSFHEIADVRKAPGDSPQPQYSYLHKLKGTQKSCGRAYYVTVIYLNVLTGAEVETDASRESWYTLPCP